MPFARHPKKEVLSSLADAHYQPFWLDDPSRPQPTEKLALDTTADLLVIGAGFTGLWTALLAKEADPDLDVVLLEGRETASGASGVNGGFVAASLTHGFDNGLQRWPNELATLIALGHANLAAIEATVKRLGIDCDYLPSGEISVATEAYQVEMLKSEVEESAPYGEKMEWLDGEQIRGMIHSPLYLGGSFDPSVAMVNPARLAWGLRQACLQVGVRLFENTPVTRLEFDGQLVKAHTPHGSVRSGRVALATNAHPPLLKRLSYYIVPVYDYALMTEPLSASQRASIGWEGRQGVGDSGNQFHYYRTTADGRILWGGYDAVYYWNNGFGAHLEKSPECFARLAGHFFQTFPQLEGLRFTHAWGGAIDTCSRFSAFWGTTHGGHTAYALGYTGLGVGATRFGAQVMLDLLFRTRTERTALQMARTKPLPFPPEPFRSLVINLTRQSLDHADNNQGSRNLWLQLTDFLGLGFNS